MGIQQKTVSIRDWNANTHVQEEKGRKIGKTDKPRTNYSCRTLLRKHPSRPDTETNKKRVSGQKQRLYIDTNTTQEDSTIIKTHPTTLNIPNKSQNQSIHDCMQ